MSQFPQDFDRWQVREVITNNAGGKKAAILDEHEGPTPFTTGILKSPFDASGYNDVDATRVDLCLDTDAQLSE